MKYMFTAFITICLFLFSCGKDADQNPDNPKENSAPQIANQSFVIVENAPLGSIVGDIEALDPDGDMITYSIVSGNTGDAFAISATSGGLSVKNGKSIDFETKTKFDLLVEVSDGSESDQAMVSIEVLDEYEGAHPAIVPCQLERAINSNVALGIPRLDAMTPSLGTINVAVLFADFDDVPANGKTTEEVFSILNPVAPDFLRDISYSRAEINFIPHHKWLRLSEQSSYYGEGIRTYQGHRGFLQEAMDLADDEYDFADIHTVLVVSHPDARDIPFGPAFGVTDDVSGLMADNHHIQNGITSGYDLNHWGGIWYVHELGHNFSLPDLYGYSGGDQHRFVGTFGMMGHIGGDAPGYFAFERWMMGWLDDDQIFCHQDGEVIVEIKELETAGGLKALMVPIDDFSALVIECRKAKGVDAALKKEGALAYVVNTRMASGTGSIVVKPGVESGDMKRDAPMGQDEEYTYRNITVKVVQELADGYKVKVVVE